MLTTRKTTRGMVLKVIKYNNYQDLDNYKRDTPVDSQKKRKRFTDDTINKNDNNEKNDNKYLEFTHLKNPVFKENWEAWLDVRKKLKAPNTEKALALNLKKLHKYILPTATAMLEQSVERGWRGVFEIKEIDNIKKGETVMERFRRS